MRLSNVSCLLDTRRTFPWVKIQTLLMDHHGMKSILVFCLSSHRLRGEMIIMPRVDMGSDTACGGLNSEIGHPPPTHRNFWWTCGFTLENPSRPFPLRTKKKVGERKGKTKNNFRLFRRELGKVPVLSEVGPTLDPLPPIPVKKCQVGVREGRRVPFDRQKITIMYEIITNSPLCEIIQHPVNTVRT